MLTIAIIAIVLGLLLLWKGKDKQQEQKEQKGFIILAATMIFLIYMFPGAALLIIGLVMIALMGGGYIPY